MERTASLSLDLDNTVNEKSAGRPVSIARYFTLPAVVLVIFSAMIVVDRIAAPRVSANVDPAFYAVAGHELVLGRSLYTDVWDHKPPAPFVAYAAAELAFGYSPNTLIIINVIVSLIILFGAYYAGRAGDGGMVSGLVAAALFMIISGNFELESRDANTEPFINACVVWAFGILATYRRTGLATGQMLAVGSLFLLGSMFKPVVVAIAAFLVIAHIILSSDRRRSIREGLVIAGAGVAGWVGLAGYFAATGRFELFYESMVSYNRYYSGELTANLIAPLQGESALLLGFMIPLGITAVVGLGLTAMRDRSLGGLLAAYIVASWIAIALPGRFSVHYFQLWLPPLVVASGWAIGRLASLKDLRLRIGAVAAGAMVIAILLFNTATEYGAVVAKQWTPALASLNAADDMAEKINGLLKNDEQFFLWGNTPNLYLLTRRRPPAAVLFDAHLRENPLFDRLSKRVSADLERTQPELLVTETGRPPVPDWIAMNYESTPIFPDTRFYSIFARRGGRIAGEK